MRDSVTAPSDQLAEELATFDACREELVATANNKWVLIKGAELCGTYDTEADAIAEGYRRLGNVPFLVKQVATVDRPMNFVSGLVDL